tara:strand:+ start:970 stop:1419 length:450 start_codon:yes stop_codon:yes gene_type:complete
VLSYNDYIDDIEEDICKITGVEYPIIGYDSNFKRCKCGKRCYENVLFCNKMFYRDIFLKNKYSILHEEEMCSSYFNQKCIVSPNVINTLLIENENNMESKVNTTIGCYKKDDIYFIEDESDEKRKVIIYLGVSCISFFIIFLFCIIIGY